MGTPRRGCLRGGGKPGQPTVRTLSTASALQTSGEPQGGRPHTQRKIIKTNAEYRPVDLPEPPVRASEASEAPLSMDGTLNATGAPEDASGLPVDAEEPQGTMDPAVGSQERATDTSKASEATGHRQAA